jgi:type II secretory pathway pseudopilin PulG
MAEGHVRTVSRGERGIALLLVLVALAILLVLAIVVSQVALSRRTKATAYRETLARQVAVRGAFDAVRERLFSKQLVLAPERAQRFALGEPLAVAVRVQVTRETDAVVARDGRVLRGLEASGIDLAQAGVHGEKQTVVKPDNTVEISLVGKRTVYEYRRLEIYLVEAEADGGPSFPAVRLLGGLARLDDGRVLSLGFRFDRGYF